MRRYATLLFFLPLSCNNASLQPPAEEKIQPVKSQAVSPIHLTDTTSWAYFLQHLPEVDGPILDYQGHPIAYQAKHSSLINYDVGNKDLQQCADALMRLRAEYLFAQGRTDEIAFHFTSQQVYRFKDYCAGILPIPKGSTVVFVHSTPHAKDRASLRHYLDYVYMYAGTISLAGELKDADDFRIGAVIIHGGSPGHCFIITNEAISPTGEKLFKLVEGYTPAQSIYVLQNTEHPELGCWYPLKKGTLKTASYEFTSYELKKFE